MTRADLAERSSLSEVYLRQVERGERDVGLGALGMLAKGLDCDVGDLLPRKGQSPIEGIIGESFGASTESVRQAVLFMLGAEDSLTRKEVFARVMAQLPPPSSAPLSPPPRRSPRR